MPGRALTRGQGATVKYLCLVYADEERIAALSDRE